MKTRVSEISIPSAKDFIIDPLKTFKINKNKNVTIKSVLSENF